MVWRMCFVQVHRGKCVHTPQDGPFGAFLVGLWARDGWFWSKTCGQILSPREFKLAAWGKVNSGMKLPMFHKMSILRLEVNFHPFTPTYSYSPFSYWSFHFLTFRQHSSESVVVAGGVESWTSEFGLWTLWEKCYLLKFTSKLLGGPPCFLMIYWMNSWFLLAPK